MSSIPIRAAENHSRSARPVVPAHLDCTLFRPTHLDRHPSRLASRTPQDDGSGSGATLHLRLGPPSRCLLRRPRGGCICDRATIVSRTALRRPQQPMASGQLFQKIFLPNCRIRTGANVFLLSAPIGGESKMWSREDIPLAVMGAASAAILFFFAVSERAMLTSPRQHDGCRWSEDAAVAPSWRRVDLISKDLWNPAFPPLPPRAHLNRLGCVGSSATATG